MKYKYKIKNKNEICDFETFLQNDLYIKNNKIAKKTLDKIYNNAKNNKTNLQIVMLHAFFQSSDYYDNWGMCQHIMYIIFKHKKYIKYNGFKLKKGV